MVHGLMRRDEARKQFDADLDAAYAKRMARSLSADEIQVLGEVTSGREQGLALCRAGDLGPGARAIGSARLRLTQARVGREAFVLSHSFLCAAEGFLHYRSGRSAAASSSLLAAIADCRELHDDFGYPVEGRRIHLACNLARVDVAAGHQARSSRTLARLLTLLENADRRYWPFPELEYATGPDLLPGAARWDLADQALDVARRLDAAAFAALHDQCPQSTNGDGRELAARTRCFLTAVRSDQIGEVTSFLERCVEFFPPGPGSLPRGFRHLAERLRTVTAGSAPTCSD
jgi:hypothetical protein